MPEGDSVLQLSNRLQFMAGREVTGGSVRVPRYATVHLDGMVCERVWPYGKHLFMQFDQTIVHTHLKMEGTWAIHYAGDRCSIRKWSQASAMNTAPRPVSLRGCTRPHR